MPRKNRIDALGGVLLFGFAATMGLNQSLVKLVNAGYAPFMQAGLRSVIALVPVLAFALLMRRRLSLTDGSLPAGVFCGLLFTGEFALLFLALDYTSVSRASIFFYTMPIWVAVGAHFLIPEEKLNAVKVIGLVLAVAGVALALWGNAAPASDKALLGDLMCLLAAICWAGIPLTARATRLSRSSPEMQLLYQLAVSAPLLIGAAWATGDMAREPTALLNGILAFQGLVIVGCIFLVWFWVLTIYPASDVASFGFLAPVFGVFFGWVLFDDALTWRLVGALALVGAGIVLVNRKRRV
ncbi:MAG: DMT family transporter [Pikeienuella sp.]